MHHVMIVDDEPIVRLAFKSLLDWEEHGFKAGFEAANGRQALQILTEHPEIDIMVTDIQMPVMDGLALIETVKKTKSDLGVAVLSAYNDYHLVRQAFKLGVKDYILKAEMDSENVLALLEGMARELEGEKGLHREGKPREFVEMRYVKEKVLRDALYSVNTELAEELRRAGLRLMENHIVICFVWVDDYQMIANRYDHHDLKPFIEAVVNAVEQVLTLNKQGEFVSLSPQEYVLFLSFSEKSLFKVRENVLTILGQIKYALTNYLNIGVSIGVSKPENGFATISDLFREAEANARLRFIFGKGRIIFPEDTEGITRAPGKGVLGNHGNFLQALKTLNPQRAKEELQLLLAAIGSIQATKIEKLYPYYMELLFILAGFLSEKGEDLVEVIGKKQDIYTKISGFETRVEINDWLVELTHNILDYLGEKKDGKGSRAVVMAQEFIRNHYQHDLTLKMVSQYVGLSESHFSCLFTKVSGACFSDYLTGIRIAKAQELLINTNLKIYEIGAAVGYASIEHFGRVFKKVTGQSPNQYRSSQIE